MLKKFGRKALSFLLVFVLMATTFFIFDPSVLLPKSKAVVDVKKLVNTVEPTVKFYVPEAIYLNPVVGTGSKPYNFQYFIDSDENGTLRRSATQTTGTVYFSCSAACTSITINWGNSVSPNVTENTHTNQIVKQTITGGTTSVRDGSVKVTATYVVEGRTYNAYAYTYMYYPELDLLTGTASSYVYKASGNEPKLAAFSFITGVHKVGNETTYGNTNERGVSNYYDQYNGSSSKGYYGISPLIPGWAHVWQNGSLVPGSSGAIFKTADEGRIYDRDIIYGETASSLPSGFLDRGNGGVYFRERERAGGTNKTYGGISNSWGILYVDTSRVTDYNQIPNLRGGFICHYYQRCGKRGEIETFASTDNTISILNNIDFRNGDGHSYGMSDADRLSGAVTLSDKTYTMRATYKYRMDAAIGSSSTVTMNQDFGFKVYPVNKKSLREAYRAAIENGWQSTTASRHGWSSSAQSQWTTAYSNLDTALASAGEVLGRPYATYSQVSTALSNLNNRVTACNNIVNANFQGGENPAVLPQVNFYVPETIYLNPSDNQTFQYFYGVETNGIPTKNLAISTAAAGAKVYFAGKNCTPTKVKITVESSGDNETNWINTNYSRLNSISFGGSSFNGSNASTSGKTYTSFPVNIQCTAGKLNAALASSSYRFLKWTAEYEVGGITYKTYAYTTVYSPYDKPVAAATRAYNSRGVESDLQSIAWISGVTGSNTNGNRTNNTDNFVPIKGTVLTPTNTRNDGGYNQDGGTYINGSSGTGHFQNRSDNHDDEGAQAVAPTGSLVLDSTRFDNLQYVPNFKIGFLISLVNEGTSSVNRRQFGYYFSDVSSLSFDSPSGYGSSNWDIYNRGGYASGNRGTYITSLTQYEDDNGATVNREYCYPRMVYNNTWDKSVTSSTTVKILGAARFGIRKKSNDRWSKSNNVNVVPVNVTVVNKSSLRSRYYEAITLSKQQDWYAAGFNEYQNSILTMAINLEHPARTTINSTVNTANLVTRTGTTTAVHLRGGSSADYNGNVGSAIIGTNTESKGYTYGDRVYGYYNEIPGFTKSNYSVTYGSTTKTSGILQDSTYNNYYYIPNANTPTIEWKFWYTPNTYSINYDPNGGTYNNTTGLTSTSVLFQSKYTVGKIGSATPANPTRPGCTFMGWKCSADGLVYQPGANINWEFLENVTFTAQWEYNSINLRFNENHDSLAENMFDPIIEETLTHDSTASDSTACSFTLEKFDDGTLKANGKLAGAYTIGFVPMKFEAGKTYHFSNLVTGGSMTNGCLVMELAKEDTNNINPRKFFNIESNSTATGTVEKPDITITQEMADQIAGIRFWIWHGNNEYMTFNNFTFKPRIELKSDSTNVATSSTEYNNIFADYMQYNTLIQELPTATRTGYTFDGWYTQANGGTKVNVGDRLLYSDWNLNNTDQTLYAHWTINKYKLMYENEFDFDNFKFSMANPPVTNTNSPITINEHENSIQFTSQKRADGVTDDFTPTGQNYTPAETGYMTLAPGHTYEISYSYTVDKAASLNCYIFSYTSTSSTSWNTEYGNSGTGTYYNVGVAPSGATTGTMTGYYTVPQGRPYARLRFGSTTEGVTVKFSDICVRDLTDPMNYRGKSGGDGKENSLNKKFDTVTYKTTQSPLATITRQGYTFNGWYESENMSNGNGYGTQFTTSTAMPARDVPLYAQWKLNEYPIVINLNADSTDKATIGSFTYSKANNNTSNGNISLSTATSSQQESAGNITTINVAYGTSFTLPIPSRTGYTFTGWTASATPAYASLTDNGNTSASAYRVGAGGVTLTAHWSRNSYPVKAYAYGDIYNSATFALGRGGTVQIASDAAGTSVSKNIAYRSTTTLKATASTGYAFVGWYTDSALTNLYSTSASITSESVLTDGRTYYAKFKVQSYTITVNPDNATTGTTISGWYSAAGAAAPSQTITTSTEITMVYGSTVTMTAPHKTGYTFGGWEKITGVGTLTSSTGTSTFKCGAGDATIKAKWTATVYTITFLPNGGSVNPTSKTFTIESTIDLPTPTKDSYVFDGWLVTTAEGNWTNGTLYTDSSIPAGKYGNVTVTAQWHKTVTVHFYSGSKGAVHNQFQITFKNNETAGSVKSPTSFGTIDGWTALGWLTSEDAGKTPNQAIAAAAITGGTSVTVSPAKFDYNYYAIYSQNQTLTYNSNAIGDSSVKNIPSSTNGTAYYNSFDKIANVTHNIPSTVPTRNGYTFASWNTEANGSGVKYNAPGTFTNSKQNEKLYAQWTENKYTITYSYNGSGTADKSINYTITSAITIEDAPTYKDHVFAGWKIQQPTQGNWPDPSKESNAPELYGPKATIASGKFGNVVFVAQWVYINSAENKSGEYTLGNEIEIVTGVESNGTKKTEKTTKYDKASFDNYTAAIEKYRSAKAVVETLVKKDVNSSGYSAALKTATKSLQDAITELTEIVLIENGIVTKYYNNFYVGDKQCNLSQMNLNHYEYSELETAKTSLINGKAYIGKDYKITDTDSANVTYQSRLNDCVLSMAKAFISTSDKVKTSVGFKVYETVSETRKVKDANENALAGDAAVNYVYAGKDGSTYYCYTNSTNPVVLITVDDGIDGGRKCYPTKAEQVTASTTTGTVKKTDVTFPITKDDADSKYVGYINAGVGKNIGYYRQKQVIRLAPEFEVNLNGTVTYEFTAHDDTLSKNVATQSALSSGLDSKNANDFSENLTASKTIKIIIDYHAADPKTGEKLDVNGDQVSNDVYFNQFHLYRNAGGAKNWELPRAQQYTNSSNGNTYDPYIVDDGVYGQKDYGSFSFTFKLGNSIDLETKMTCANGNVGYVPTLNTTDASKIAQMINNGTVSFAKLKSCEYTAAGEKPYYKLLANGDYETETVGGKTKNKIYKGGTGYGFIPWPKSNIWSFNYYPENGAYTYVHLVDRWGNTVDKVIYVGLQDPRDITTSGSDGIYTILEDGGSGIDTLSLNAGTFEILTDENSTLENNVYRTTGNTVRIKTGEANKSYTLSMKDKATNASTATIESDGNGIITLSIDDAMYKSGVYTFMLNGTEINLYDGVNNDKYILNVYDGEAEEGEAAEMIVITTGEVGKTRFTDTDGNTVTVAASETNEDGTKTWRMSKSRPAGEYEYRISVKVGHDWIEENSTGKLIFTEKQLDTGRIVKAEYDEESGLYRLTIEGRATKIQFITEDGMTRTYTRYSEAVKSRKSYDAEGNEVPDTGRLLDHEVWLVNARLYSGQNYTVAGKFEAGWNREGTATLTGH